MLLILGYIIVIVATIGGFIMGGGHLLLLAHASEFVVIGGISLGMLVIASPKSVMIALIKDLKTVFGPARYSSETFLDLFKMLYELFFLSRSNGMLALDDHLNDPNNSSILQRYPSFLSDSGNVSFFTNALRPLIDGKLKANQVQELLFDEIGKLEEESSQTISILNIVGDSLPGIGIVAAVLGIINTMSAISQGPEMVGQKVAAALTGTFLGVLGAYGFVNPLAKRIQFAHQLHFHYLYIMARSISGFANGLSPLVALEFARRNLDSSVAPSANDLETVLKSLNTKKQ